MKSLVVKLSFSPERKIEIGTLTQHNGRSVFQFSPEFLARPLPISPFHLPGTASLLEYDRRGGMETFGVFEDSLPDGWGRKIIDSRFMKAHGRVPTVLERLACVADNGAGALTYHPPDEDIAEGHPLDLGELALHAWDFDDGKIGDVLPVLRQNAGSSGGARPKALVALNDSGDVLPNILRLPEGFSHWIVKFNSRSDGVDAGAIECAYNEIARRAGADVPEFRLIQTKAGSFFATKRFDRLPNGERLHLHSAAGLLHANFRIAGDEYETLFRLTEALTRDYSAKKELFRRVCLNVFAHNRDDHLKNFAFLMDVSGSWRLSPLYDFTRNDGPGGWHTLSVAGEGRNPGEKDLLRLAESVDLAEEEAKEIIAVVREVVEEKRGSFKVL